MNTSSADHQETADGVAYFIDQKPAPADFLAEVLEGLARLPKSIPPKFFYDETGSSLFNKICETPEYYVTRTEVALMNTIGPEIAALAGPSRAVIEYGCGSSLKINALLTALESPSEYLAIDISKEHLLQTAADIAAGHSSVKVGALCTDFSGDLVLPEALGGSSRRLAFFPGSTIGNQTPSDAQIFLQNVRQVVGEDGSLLIGVDLEKDKSINPIGLYNLTQTIIACSRNLPTIAESDENDNEGFTRAMEMLDQIADFKRDTLGFNFE